ncbi:MAG: hypothetical protein WA510_17665 [Acidobacteriaceae bacterium]
MPETPETTLPLNPNSKIDRMAPAGSPNSLGAESVRDGRPATDDSVVEAMDEESPGIDPLSVEDKGPAR